MEMGNCMVYDGRVSLVGSLTVVQIQHGLEVELRRQLNESKYAHRKLNAV